MDSITRRRLLALGGSAMGVALAGCTGQADPSGEPPTEGDAFLQHLSFDGPDLVVQLVEGHSVTRLNLIAPDGSLFDQTSVATGATTARIEVLDIKPEGAGMKHYTPGEHELVAVGESESQSATVNLVPDLRIVDVRQYREGTKASDYGKLVVEVENVGTGPTWVYSVKYRNAPNFAANDEPGGDPGVPVLEFPEVSKKTIIPPGGVRNFVGAGIPILFVDQVEQDCVGEFSLVVVVESPVTELIEQPVAVVVEGQAQSAGLVGQYTCSDVGIRLEREFEA